MKEARIEKDRDQENDPDLERRDRGPVTERSDPDHVIERSVQDHVIVRSVPDHVIEGVDDLLPGSGPERLDDLDELEEEATIRHPANYVNHHLMSN